MTIKDYLSSSYQIFDALKKEETLINYLKKISEYNDKYILFYKRLRGSFTPNANSTQNQMAPVIKEINSVNNEVLAEIRKMKPFNVISSFQSLVQDFQKVEILQNELKDFIEDRKSVV